MTTLLREVRARVSAAAINEAYERERLEATALRGQSPQDYIRYQMLAAESLVGRMRPFLPPGQLRVLEVGCGTGGISLYLASQGFKVIAVDRQQYEAEAVRTAREFSREHRIPLDVSLADGAALPLGSATIDCVVCSNVVEHLDDPERTLAEMLRVLVPGGLAFVDFPLFLNVYGGHIDDSIRVPWFHLLPAAWVEAALRRRQAERDRCVFLTLNRITNARFRRIARRLGFETVHFGRAHYLTHPGRKFVVSLLASWQRRSPARAWRALREAVSDFSSVELGQFPLLLLSVPLAYVPGVSEFFTSGVRYVLRKPGHNLGPAEAVAP